LLIYEGNISLTQNHISPIKTTENETFSENQRLNKLGFPKIIQKLNCFSCLILIINDIKNDYKK